MTNSRNKNLVACLEIIGAQKASGGQTVDIGRWRQLTQAVFDQIAAIVERLDKDDLMVH